MTPTNTRDIATKHINVCVYGYPGSGKTTLVKTLHKPLLISVEGGTLCLAGSDIDVLEVRTMAEMAEAYTYAVEHAQEYSCIALDSFTELAKICLAELTEKYKDAKDNWGPYRDLGTTMKTFLRKLRDLPVDVYVSALCSRDKDQSGIMYWAPEAPGSQLSGELCAIFDEVFVLRTSVDADGKTSRMLQTSNDGQYIAKDRSGKLSSWEEPNLSAIFDKIRK